MAVSDNKSTRTELLVLAALSLSMVMVLLALGFGFGSWHTLQRTQAMELETHPDETPLEWEELQAVPRGSAIHRTRTPTGWLVLLGRQRPVFVEDPKHEWVSEQP